MFTVPTTLVLRSIKNSLGNNSRKRNWFQNTLRRTNLSATIEPPLDSTIIEKPCTVLLMEDRAMYDESWNASFHSSIPVDYGMSFASISFSEHLDFDGMLQELKDDLLPLNDAVLIARGPLSSWCAQFYLESFSLKGLVMVDPVLLESIGETEAEAIQKLKEYSSRGCTSEKFEAWNKLLGRAQERKLLLEPSVVPILIMHTYDDSACKISATRVAKRHSGDEGSRFGDVPVRAIPQLDNNKLMTGIDKWIESIL